jgi:hypothetical protein
VIFSDCHWETDSVVEASVNLRRDECQLSILDSTVEGECAILEQHKRQVPGGVANEIHQSAIAKRPELRLTLSLSSRR